MVTKSNEMSISFGGKRKKARKGMREIILRNSI